MGPCTDEEKAARRPLMLDSIARITEEAARLDAVFAVESVDVHPLCTPELLRTVLDTAADIQHCKVIFDPVNLFCAKGRAGQSVPDCPLEPLAGGHRQSARCRTRQGLPHRGGWQQNAAAAGRAGDMDYSAIRAFLANRAPAAPLLRDEVILPADTADVRYLRKMTDTV